jgi:hypothetical protein
LTLLSICAVLIISPVAWNLDDGQSRQTGIRCNDRWHVALHVSIPASLTQILRVTWFSRYDACDVGTLPNQTWVNGTGPAAALNSPASRAKYNYSLSYLSGQRLSYAISLRLAVLHLNPFSVFLRPVHVPVLARITLVQAPVRVGVLRKSMCLRPNTINKVLAG